MKKVLATMLSLVMMLGVLAACGSDDSSSSGSTGSTGSSTEGGATATGDRDATVYREVYGSEFTTFNYLTTGNNNELKVLADCIDPLVEYDEYGVPQPGLAESWSHNDDYTVWTFNIRQGAMWYDFEGNEVAEVTAQDWVDSAEYVNNAFNDSDPQYMFEGFVVNATTYYDQTADELEAENAVADGEYASVEEYYEDNDIDTSSWISFEDVGVKAVDTYTLEYTLETPCTYFLSVLSYSAYLPVYGPYLEQVGDSFGLDHNLILYCGAYIMTEYEPQNRRILEVNENYWDRDNVYITRLEWIYNANEATVSPAMFQQGEADMAIIPSDILDEWMGNEETANLIRPSTLDLDYSYFYAFNFEPRFDDEYEPDNWIIAVNNENFRKSLVAGLDRVKAVSVIDPYAPEALLSNTVTPVNFAYDGGKDYTEFGDLPTYVNTDSFNEEEALAYRDAAIEELTAAGASFPIKVLMPYNPTTSNWDLECQVVEQQLEALLGSDYIDVIVEAGPSTGFLGEVRRSGKYAFMKCNWGADFEDPSTYSEPFATGNSYNFMYTSDNELMGAPRNNKTAETQALVDQYYALADAAAAIDGTDTTARYEAYAAAEAFLLEHAFIAPIHSSSDGYVADMRNPFDRQFSNFGLAKYRMKGRQLLEEPMNSEQYAAALAEWEEGRTAALTAAAE